MNIKGKVLITIEILSFIAGIAIASAIYRNTIQPFKDFISYNHHILGDVVNINSKLKRINYHALVIFYDYKFKPSGYVKSVKKSLAAIRKTSLETDSEYSDLFFDEKMAIPSGKANYYNNPNHKNSGFLFENKNIIANDEVKSAIFNSYCNYKFVYTPILMKFIKHSDRFSVGLDKKIFFSYLINYSVIPEHKITDRIFKDSDKLADFADIAFAIGSAIIFFLFIVFSLLLNRYIANLDDSEKKFKKFFDENPLVMLIINPETGKITDVNVMAEKYYGFSRTELLSMKISDIAVLDESEHKRMRLEVFNNNNNDSRIYTLKHRLRNGNIRTVETSLIRITIKGEAYLIDAVNDITERIEYQDRLSKLNAKLDKAILYYNMLVSINEIKEDDELLYLKKVVEIISGISGFEENIWIGRLVSRESLTLETIAYTGKYGAIIDDFYKNSSWREKSVTLNAIKTKRLYYTQNYSNDLTLDNDMAKESNIASGAAVPILRNGEVWGIISMASPKAEMLHGDILDIFQRIANLIGREFDEIDLKLKEEQSRKIIENLAYNDPLTGIPNRASFMQRIKSAASRAKRYGRPLTLIMLDLDGFKEINDTFGHEAGDRVLAGIAGRIKSSLRQEDEVFRIGGDEFTVIVDNFQSEENVAEISKRIIKEINLPFIFGDNQSHVGVSIGIAVKTNEGLDCDELIRIADAAMYEVKSGGKNDYRIKYI